MYGDRTLHPRAVPPGAFPSGTSLHWTIPSVAIPSLTIPSLAIPSLTIPPRTIPPIKIIHGNNVVWLCTKYAVDANLFQLESSILTRAKRATNRNNVGGEHSVGEYTGVERSGGSIPRITFSTNDNSYPNDSHFKKNHFTYNTYTGCLSCLGGYCPCESCRIEVIRLKDIWIGNIRVGVSWWEMSEHELSGLKMSSQDLYGMKISGWYLSLVKRQGRARSL